MPHSFLQVREYLYDRHITSVLFTAVSCCGLVLLLECFSVSSFSLTSSVCVLGKSATSHVLNDNSLMKNRPSGVPQCTVPCSPGPGPSVSLCVACTLLFSLDLFFLQSSGLQRLSSKLRSGLLAKWDLPPLLPEVRSRKRHRSGDVFWSSGEQLTVPRIRHVWLGKADLLKSGVETCVNKLGKECWCHSGSHRWPLFMLGGQWCLAAPLFPDGSLCDPWLSRPCSQVSKALFFLSTPAFSNCLSTLYLHKLFTVLSL